MSMVFRQEFAVTETAGNLTISGVSGCSGAVAERQYGNTASLVAAYKIVPPSGYINIHP